MKRWLWFVVCAAAMPAIGCGGNVVVDGDAGGSGGGGSGSTTTTSAQVGSACEAVCEALTKCGGGPANPPCDQQCAPVVELAEKSGCAVETAAFYECIAASPDLCTQVGCTAEINDYVSCISLYCSANPDDCSDV